MKTINIHLDPPDAAQIETWRKQRSRCDRLEQLRFVSIVIQIISSVVLFVLSSLSLLSLLPNTLLWPLISCVVFFVLLSFFTGIILRQWSAETPETDDLEPASPDQLAKLSVFLGTKEVKVYLQKVAQQRRLLTQMEFRRLISAPDDLHSDALRQEQLALVEGETGLCVMPYFDPHGVPQDHCGAR